MLHSKQWYYSLHRDFQNCYSTRRSLTRFFSSNSSSNATRAHYITIQRILHPESNSTYRRQRALRVLQSRNSTHRRQGDLLEMHPCVLHDIPGNSSCSRDIPDIPVIHDLPAFQAILQCSSISRESTPFQHSPTRMHILHILQFNWFPQKLHRVPVGQLQTLQTFILQRKGDVAISVKMSRCQDDIFPRIELIPSFVLSSDNTNCKNDIQLFLQLFDELSVHTDYH